MVIRFIEELLFCPSTLLQKAIVFLLAPLSFIYRYFAWRSLVKHKPIDLGIAVISIGNLTLGGSGKTPLTAAIAGNFDKAAIVLRGYKRETKNLIVLDENSAAKDVGDEAVLYRSIAKNAIVIVSQDRKEGILKAKELGADTVLLDDGFRHRGIKKYDILIKPDPLPTNNFCIPAGCYRFPQKAYNLADYIAIEGKDFKRIVNIRNPKNSMVLVTAISRAQRLDKYLPQNITAKYIFKDHSFFDLEQLSKIAQKHNADSLLVTQKDLVKLRGAPFEISVLELKIELKPHFLEAITAFKAQNG